MVRNLDLKTHSCIINIHAGFDETSELIQHTFNPASFIVFDFYDPEKHTEVSIKRARKYAYVFPGTRTINTENFKADINNVDCIFLFLAAHEIRNKLERITFFEKLYSMLNSNGKIIVVEHLRNLPNFIAYNIGAFHFFSKQIWKSTFQSAGFNTVSEIKINLFIKAFVLHKE